MNTLMVCLLWLGTMGGIAPWSTHLVETGVSVEDTQDRSSQDRGSDGSALPDATDKNPISNGF